MAPSEVGNQLKSQSLGEVISSAFAQVGGRVFPDTQATQSLLDLMLVVDSWRATHTPAYGGPCSNAGVGYVAVPSSLGDPVDLVAADDNEVIRIQGISLENIDSSAIDYDIHLGTALLSRGSVAGNQHVPVTDLVPLFISKGQTITITATSGTANRLNAHATGVKTVLP